MKFEESIFINRPVEEVFAYVTDYSTHTGWAGAASVDILTDGPFGVGSRMRYVERVIGRDVAAESEITIYDRPHRLGYEFLNGMDSKALQTFTEENGGTRFTWEYWANMTGVLSVFKIAEPLFVPIARKKIRTSLEKLKKALEADAQDTLKP